MAPRKISKEIIFVGLIAGTLTQAAIAHAAVPFLTWEAGTYAPLEYPGRHLPTANSRIFAQLDVLDNGKVANLSSAAVYWYLNDNLIAQGAGLASVAFTAPELSGGTLDLRAEVPDRNILKTVEIPVVKPESVIEAPFASGKVTTASVVLQGKPYFFNVADPINLSYVWQINGQAPEGTDHPDWVTINISKNTPDGFPLNIHLNVVNPNQELEGGSGEADFTYSHG